MFSNISFVLYTESIISTFPQMDWHHQRYNPEYALNFHGVTSKNIDADDVIQICKLCLICVYIIMFIS